MTEREQMLEAELKASRLEVKLLKGKVDALVRKLYGKKSEKIDPNQLMFLGKRHVKHHRLLLDLVLVSLSCTVSVVVPNLRHLRLRLQLYAGTCPSQPG